MHAVLLMMCAALGVPDLDVGNEGVFMPWGEFERLYRESVERDVLKQAPPPPHVAQVYSIDEARYVLTVDGVNAQGNVTYSGNKVSGDPEAIPLLGREAVITNITQGEEGGILSGKQDEGMLFMPVSGMQVFQITANFLVQSSNEENSRTISLTIPQALQNSLELKLPADSKLLEAPGILGADGRYHFGPALSLKIKYLDRQALAATTVTEIDSVSRITVQKNRVNIATAFLPVRPLRGSLVLHVPEGAACIASSLPSSCIKKRDAGSYEIQTSTSDKNPFQIELVLETVGGAENNEGEIVLRLPEIEGNTGEQGRFVVEEPDDGQVTASATGLVTQIPIEKLDEKLTQEIGRARVFMKVPASEKITLSVRRFQSVATPTLVLEGQSFFSAVDENGSVLSVLVLDVPAGAGERMALKSVAEAEIWSLTVNGVKQNVYLDDQAKWIIPLDGGKVSHVELAFLRRGTKLGLQGRIDVPVPESALPSQEIRVGIALPSRVQLMSIEGPVSPTSGEGWKLPAEFRGKPHFFSRSFYKGEGMSLAISYKEPVNQAEVQKGTAQ